MVFEIELGSFGKAQIEALTRRRRSSNLSNKESGFGVSKQETEEKDVKIANSGRITDCRAYATRARCFCQRTR